MSIRQRATAGRILFCGLSVLAIALLLGKPWLVGAESSGHSRKPLPGPDEIRNLPTDGGPDYNRLVFEKSPYLLQHAGNPVDWYPWGDEAFEKAHREDKPIFLSIGYSTCHWCHVMEHESFEDEEVAALLNEHFVSIKVDREERPDVDSVYMQVCQMMTRSGGWPLTIVMTPDKKPFFAGTYFPKTRRFGRAGMTELLPAIGQAWRENREQLLSTAGRVIARLEAHSMGRPGSDLDADVLEKGFRQLADSFDATHGGFGRAPKFPTPHKLSFLLRYWRRSGDESALSMVEKTLEAMRRGGIFDHVGFGFHRYSTDPRWLVPHFEKMLYDQAMLTIAYAEAYQATGDKGYARTAREVLTYVLRDMTAPEGAFYSAEDADSEGVEGKFYLWTSEQVESVLGESDTRLFMESFNIEPEGNFRSAHSPQGTNIPHLTRSPAALAGQFGLVEVELRRRLEAAREKLFAARQRRVHPQKDDKILTDWNGLMIAATAKAARIFDDTDYAAAAQRAADFVWDRLRDSEGRLRKRYRAGQAALPAHVEDYAFMIWGLLELYETNFEVRNLKRALKLNRQLLERFWDDRSGGFFFTADDGETLLVRPKEVYDGAIPSGNSVAMQNLLRLARITGDSELEAKASAIGRAFSSQVRRAPMAHAQLLCALDFAVGPTHEVVIAGRERSQGTRAMLRALRAEFVPNKVVLLRPVDKDLPEITEMAPFTKNQLSRNGQATAYVCRNQQCKLPTTDPKVMLASLLEPPAAPRAE